MRRFGIGICSEGCGLIPQLLLQSESNELFIGFNSEVVAFNLFDKKVLFRINLASLFRAFVHWRKKRILVFHEIGVMAINEDGREIWGYDKDIIEECKIDRDYLHLRFMDAEPVTISLVDGKKLSTTNR